MIEELKGVDWVKYLERKNPFLLFVVSLIAHGPMLKERTGFGYKNQFFIHKSDVGVTFSSREEQITLPTSFLELLKNHDPRLKEWYKTAVEQNSLADEIIEMYKNNIPEITVENYDNIMNQLIETFFWGTVVPYYVLAGINILLEKGESTEDYKEDFSHFEKLRGMSRYPDFLSYVLSKYLQKASEILKLKEENIELAGYLTPNELGKVLEGKSEINEDKLLKRREGCTAIFDYDKKDVEVLLKYEDISIKSGELIDRNEFIGNIANKGKAEGKIRIVNHPVDMKGFEKGEIVISINTNPSLMPVLRQCSAIVTDDGGIMCHAAIVSRELNVPCVIGTKIATKVLKNGDEVEVDADNGVVKILERAK